MATPILKKTWLWLRQQLYRFGGAMRSGELCEGWYIDPDTKEEVEDRSQRYFVALPERDVAKLRSLLEEACEVFQQKCIYLSIAGRVEFVRRRHDDPS
jgi:hypothetical protein